MTNTTNRSEIVSKEPWPASGIGFYSTIGDGPWGYLLVYADGHFEFDSRSQPSRDEILSRWAAYLSAEVEVSAPRCV